MMTWINIENLTGESQNKKELFKLNKKHTTITITHTSKPKAMLEPLRLLLMPELKVPPMPPLPLRKPSRRRCQPLRMLRLKPLLSLSQRLPTNQLKLKEPGPKPELTMPLKLPPLPSTTLSEKKSSLTCGAACYFFAFPLSSWRGKPLDFLYHYPLRDIQNAWSSPPCVARALPADVHKLQPCAPHSMLGWQ